MRVAVPVNVPEALHPARAVLAGTAPGVAVHHLAVPEALPVAHLAVQPRHGQRAQARGMASVATVASSWVVSWAMVA